jgi:tRNA 2-selenouridine synthase
MRSDTADYRAIFLSGVPLLDTRAPVEFRQGAFPNTVNLPLMTDIERQKVGTCYKQKGQQAAIELGHKLVAGKTKQERIAAWEVFAKANPDGYLYCFRGGLRSQIAQQWLESEAGISYPRVTGGYKAMRSFLIQTLDDALAECQFLIVGGMTGTGKTEVVTRFGNALDLEGHANHRGSSFGKRATPQPSQIAFENAFSVDILKKRAAGFSHFLLEDESHLIGACCLPQSLHEGMQRFPLVWLEDSLDSRIERILRDYVIDLSAEFIAVNGEEIGFSLFAERLLKNLAGITRRLGDERYQQLAAIMQQALDEQQKLGETGLHRVWIKRLLLEYYDPMYAHQRESKADRIVFMGNHTAVMEYLGQIETKN